MKEKIKQLIQQRDLAQKELSDFLESIEDKILAALKIKKELDAWNDSL